ncbi:hypothetical protein AB0A73_21355 [Glycomyces sp. NPDC047369]
MGTYEGSLPVAGQGAQVAGRGGNSSFEVLGRWQSSAGNWLSLKARRRTGYASVWLDYNGHPVKIGYAVHSGGVLREVRWEVLWAEQTDAWKTQQRRQIASLLAAWHAEGVREPPAPSLPSSVVGTFNVDGFRFAVEPTVASEHVVLSVVNTENALTPVADLLHYAGRICGMATRPGWKGTPEERRRLWRFESEAILTRAAGRGLI